MPVRHLKSCWLNFLSNEQIEPVRQAIFTLLDEIGVRVEWLPALQIYRDHGCPVDFNTHLVRIPEHILLKALDRAPHSFQLHAADLQWTVNVTLDDVYTIAGSSALSVLDLEGVHRPAQLKDLGDFTRLLDALDQVHIMHAMVIPQDIAQDGFDRILFAEILKNTTRHYYSQGMGAGSVTDQVELASIIQGGVTRVREAPLFSMVICLNSPLVHSAERVQEMLECAAFGIPVWLEPTNMMGATAPVDIAGALVENCANSLAAVTLMQLISPGHPCVLSTASGSFNMRTGAYVAVSPEAVLLHCATAQVAHSFGLPFQGGSGLDSPLPDAQAGYERMLQAAPMSLAGVNFIHLAFGMIDQLLTASYEQALIDAEIFSAAFRLCSGIPITSESLSLDQFRQAGPGGQFLNQRYTRQNYRRLHWQPALTCRLSWEDFQRTHQGKDMRQRANEEARHILAEHHPQPFDDRTALELDQTARRLQRAIQKDT